MRCARHPKVETALSCGRCGAPICPDCMKPGAVGLLCPACANPHTGVLYQVRPERFALAALLGLLAGTLIGLVLQRIGLFIFFLAPLIGGLLGEVILRATGRKRGPRLEVLAGASVVAGAGLSLLISGDGGIFVQPIRLVFFGIAVALTSAAAIAKMRL